MKIISDWGEGVGSRWCGSGSAHSSVVLVVVLSVCGDGVDNAWWCVGGGVLHVLLLEKLLVLLLRDELKVFSCCGEGVGSRCCGSGSAHNSVVLVVVVWSLFGDGVGSVWWFFGGGVLHVLLLELLLLLLLCFLFARFNLNARCIICFLVRVVGAGAIVSSLFGGVAVRVRL